MLKAKRFFNNAEMVLQYKSHILSFIEHCTPGIYHACCTVLAPLDAIQKNFLEEMGLNDIDALHLFNLAPLRCRRDMAMLGFIHRTVLGKGAAHVKGIFIRAPTTNARSTRHNIRRHTKHLHDPRDLHYSEQTRLSALGWDLPLCITCFHKTLWTHQRRLPSKHHCKLC